MSSHKAQAHIKAEDQVIRQIVETVKPAELHVIPIRDSLPLNAFGVDTPILWQLTGAEPQELKDFLYHLKDSRRRHVILGSANDLLAAVQTLWPRQVVEPTHLSDPVPHPQGKPDSMLTRSASVIFSGPPSERLDSILSICGYASSHDTIPMDKARIEQATLVILVASPDMVAKFAKIQGILSTSLKKEVILLDESRCEDMLTQQLAARGELPGWSTGTSSDMLLNPKLTELMEAHLGLLLSHAAFETELQTYRSQGLDAPREAAAHSLSLWIQKCIQHSVDSPSFTPWAHPASTLGTNDPLHGLGVSLSMCLSSLRASRNEILGQCELLLRASGLPSTWGPLREDALPLLKNLMFRQTMVKQIQRIQATIPTTAPKPVERKSASWFGPKQERPTQELLPSDKPAMDLKAAIRQCEMERSLLSKVLVDLYWNLYSKAFSLWPSIFKCEASSKIRALLRTGYIGNDFLDYSQEQIGIVRKMTEAPSGPWEYSGHERHVLFADELAEAIQNGLTGTGLDEELELNGKGSDDWKTSRKFRQRATLLRHQGVCRRKSEELTIALRDLDSKIQALESDPTVRDLKIHRARLAEHLETTQRLMAGVPMAAMSAQGEDKAVSNATLQTWLEREAKLLRRYSRLCAEMKENFIPDVLQRELSGDTLKLGGPASVIQGLTQLEELDTTLFDITLSGSRKPEGRLVATVSPTFIILPGAGQMAFVAESHDELTEGRICLPLISQNPRGLMGLLVQAAADFRWDSSMAEAGPEWVTSESLVGAYSRARWDYRRMEKDSRERALVYKEENDRKNFRRHYQLYLSSAKEQGRLLFYKSKVLYAALNKHIPLPPGVSKMET
ncbi:MAG: hypothetical protein AB7F75_11480 [Planctomycetota bacterium]